MCFLPRRKTWVMQACWVFLESRSARSPPFGTEERGEVLPFSSQFCNNMQSVAILFLVSILVAKFARKLALRIELCIKLRSVCSGYSVPVGVKGS